MSTGGVLLGAAAGPMLGRRAEVAGGLVLIALGLKILVEHQFLGG
jgi:putative Mn2+ efflux pump MntP